MPVSVLFSHGYSKPLCSLNFPSSSQRAHLSCVSSLFTLWPHCHLITVPGLLLDYRGSSAPVMKLLRGEILTPFPVFHPVLVSYCLASPSLSHLLPATLCFTWLPKFPSYSLFLISATFSLLWYFIFSFFSKIFFNLFQRHHYGFSGIGAFQVLNELGHKYG